MSLVRTFYELINDAPVQVELDRTVTQYTQAGPILKPTVIASGEESPLRKGDVILTSRASRVLRGTIPALLRRAVGRDLTLYLDHVVTILTKDRPEASLLDLSGRLEGADGVVALRSRAMTGTWMKLYADPGRILFFSAEEPVEAEVWTPGQMEQGITFEIKLSNKGQVRYVYVPAERVLSISAMSSLAVA